MAFMAMTWLAQGLPDEWPILRLSRCGAPRSRDPQQVIARAFIYAIPRTERSGVLSFMAPGNGLPARGLLNIPRYSLPMAVRRAAADCNSPRLPLEDRQGPSQTEHPPALKAGGGALGDLIPIALPAISNPISRHRYGSDVIGCGRSTWRVAGIQLPHLSVVRAPPETQKGRQQPGGYSRDDG